MTQKFLYALAFLVTIAVVSNAVPSGYISQIRAANNSQNVSHHLIVGSRLPGDRLTLRQSVVKSSSWSQIVTTEQVFSASGYETITQVKALDQKTNGTGAVASVIRGGPGHRNVTLRFKSQRGHGINFAVELYSRR